MLEQAAGDSEAHCSLRITLHSFLTESSTFLGLWRPNAGNEVYLNMDSQCSFHCALPACGPPLMQSSCRALPWATCSSPYFLAILPFLQAHTQATASPWTPTLSSLALPTDLCISAELHPLGGAFAECLDQVDVPVNRPSLHSGLLT